MARRDLIITFLSTVPDRILSRFRDRPLTIQSPVQQKPNMGYPGGRTGYRKWLSEHASGRNVIPGLFRAAGGTANDTIGRVAVYGFSNGCIGVDEVLSYDDGFQVDCAMAIDGIHGWYNDASQKTLVVSAYKNWYNFGFHTATKNPEQDPNAPICVITHSSITQPDFPSTTETATYIWEKVVGRLSGTVLTEFCGYDCVPRQRLARLESITYGACSSPPSNGCCGSSGGVCRSGQGDGPVTFYGLNDGWYRKSIANNFHVFGWRNKGKTGYPDHLFQGQRVLPAMAGEFLVRRWGGSCDGDVPISGFGEDESCVLPQGIVYGNGSDKQDYFPEIPNVPGLVAGISKHPYMPGLHYPPGIQAPLAEEETKESPIYLVDVAAGIAGIAAGYFGVRYLTRKM